MPRNRKQEAPCKPKMTDYIPGQNPKKLYLVSKDLSVVNGKTEDRQWLTLDEVGRMACLGYKCSLLHTPEHLKNDTDEPRNTPAGLKWIRSFKQ